MLETPVAFFVFNRPDTTARVFARIREARPQKIFVVADGPRSAHPQDKETCAAVREIVSRIDWPAQVLTNFSDENMGCGRRVSSGLDWVFDQVEEAIILEDDCLPSRGFFSYCEQLLDRYRHDTRIGIISGNNFVHPKIKTEYSYYFSRYPHIWGWATWRSSWKKYDFHLDTLDLAIKLNVIAQICYPKTQVCAFWTDRFTKARRERRTWASALTYTSFSQSWLNVLPSRNLVANIGFGADATHTRDPGSRSSRLPADEPDAPLRHPPFVVRNALADQRTDEKVFKINRPSRFAKMLSKFARRAGAAAG